MHVTLLLIVAFIWLLIFWIGSIALEATGMQRSKARFQVLSAITGTGFTTSEAESVVNNPRRRMIATWLIFIGNTGIIAFVIGLILFVRAGMAAPTPLQIGIIVIVIIAIILFVKLGVVDKVTNGIIRIFYKGQRVPYLLTEGILHQKGDYGIARIAVSEGDKASSLTLKDSALLERGITILAIERGDAVLSLPKSEETVLSGDYLLCYGKVAEMTSMTQ